MDERIILHVDCDLMYWHQQRKLSAPTNISEEIEKAAMDLFTGLYPWYKPIRSLGIRVGSLQQEGQPRQMSLFIKDTYVSEGSKIYNRYAEKDS